MRWWEQEDLELVGMRTADREAERVDRDKEEERADMDMDYYVGGYCSNHNTLGTDPNATLAYDPCSELHQPTMSMLGGHRGQLEREICGIYDINCIGFYIMGKYINI